jgi:hypothetical protein
MSMVLPLCVTSMLWLVVTGCGNDGAPGEPVAGTGGTGGAAGTGSVAGTGGAMAGVSGSGGGPSAGCSAADSSVTGSAAHAAALQVLAGMASCGASSSCHRGNGKAMLVLNTMTDLHAGLVGKNSCLVPSIPLVDGRGGDAALRNSWLWLKLTHPLNASGTLVPEAAWGAPAGCDSLEPNSFGYRMPWIMSQDMYGPPTTLNAVRNWICAGAPGP